MLKIYNRAAYGLGEDIYGRPQSTSDEIVTVVELDGKIEAVVFQAGVEEEPASTDFMSLEEFMKTHSWECIPWAGRPGRYE